jgi:hypothetical protein
VTSPYRITAGIPEPVRKVEPRPVEAVRYRNAPEMFRLIIEAVQRHGGPVLTWTDARLWGLFYDMLHARLRWAIAPHDMARTCPEHLRLYLKTSEGLRCF